MEEILERLRGGSYEGSDVEALLAAYDESIGNFDSASAKNSELENTIAELQNSINDLKARNYDLIVAGQGAKPDDDNNNNDDSDNDSDESLDNILDSYGEDEDNA